MGTLITNKHGLPDAIVRAVMVDKHRTYGDISVTQLIDAPQVRILKRQNDFEVDAMDMIWAVMGTAVHKVVELGEINQVEGQKLFEAKAVLEDMGQEKGAAYIQKIIEENFPDALNPDVLMEKSLTIEVEGMVISGTLDKYTKSLEKLSDYKNCSVWMAIFEESKKKWYAQLNTYAYMLRMNGLPVKEAEIVAIFRDWSPNGLMRSRDYPKHQVQTIPIQLFDDATMDKYLRKRVNIHKQALLGNVAQCTGAERWSTESKYAVMRKGYKKAVKLCASMAYADQYMHENRNRYSDMYVQHRPGEDKRCERWCPVKDKCPQYQGALNKIAEDTSDGTIK